MSHPTLPLVRPRRTAVPAFARIKIRGQEGIVLLDTINDMYDTFADVHLLFPAVRQNLFVPSPAGDVRGLRLVSGSKLSCKRGCPQKEFFRAIMRQSEVYGYTLPTLEEVLNIRLEVTDEMLAATRLRPILIAHIPFDIEVNGDMKRYIFGFQKSDQKGRWWFLGFEIRPECPIEFNPRAAGILYMEPR